MKVSLFIPTIPNHIKYLNRLFEYIDKSFVKPDEVVLSISDYDNCDKKIIDEIQEKYNVNIIKHNKIMLAGPNRQVSKDVCSGDIIIYQDGDDLPHKQRIEVIKHYFENYDIMCLNHSYLPNHNLDFDICYKTIKIINSDNLYNKYFPEGTLKDCINYCGAYGGGFDIPIHSGVPSIRKEVLDIVNWKDRNELSYSPGWNNSHYKGAEDYEFCMETLYHFKKSIIIDSKIYSYTT